MPLTLMSPESRPVKSRSDVGWKTKSNTCEPNLMSVELIASGGANGGAAGERKAAAWLFEGALLIQNRNRRSRDEQAGDGFD